MKPLALGAALLPVLLGAGCRTPHYHALEISTTPSDQSSRAIERKVGAIWSAVERACERDDFRPKPSRLCEYCAFRVYCPAFGGDIAEGARVAAAIRSTATVADLVPTAVAH